MSAPAAPLTLSPARCRCDELARDPRFQRRGFELKGRCTPARRYDWSCAACRSGPYSYDPRHHELPIFTKTILTPGVVQGVLLEFCSLACAQTLNRVDMASLAPAAPVARPNVEQASLDFETVEKLLTPATVQHIATLATGRGQTVRAVMITSLNELENYGALVTVPMRSRPTTDRLLVDFQQTLGAPLAADFFTGLLDTTRSRIESLAAQRGQPLELVAADAIEFYFVAFIR
jgi:hypothetical protein